MHLDNEMDLRPTSARLPRFAPALYPALFVLTLLLFAIQHMFTRWCCRPAGCSVCTWQDPCSLRGGDDPASMWDARRVLAPNKELHPRISPIDSKAEVG